MEIVIENPSSDGAPLTTTSTIPSPGFSSHPAHSRPYRASYVTSDGLTPNVEYYSTLQPPRPRSRILSPEPDYDVQIPTTVRRVDRSGLLEIADHDPQQQRSTSARPRHLTGAENHSGTLTRRIDRSGLLEAVPELPDQCPGWRTPEKSTTDRKLSGADTEIKHEDTRQRATSPRRSTEVLATQEANDQRSRTSPTSFYTNMTSSCSSPYLRRYPGVESPNSIIERPTPIIVTTTTGLGSSHGNSLTCVSPSSTKFMPIDTLTPRARQSYVDLTGATYTRSNVNSPIAISSANSTDSQTDKKPDCIGRLSPRSRGERQSPLTMSAIPDVIEAHGSRVPSQQQQQRVGSDIENNDKAPEGERAEAEGCEHTAIESLEETRVSFKASNKILHNDNIQTLRVIILSEQL